MIGLLTRPLRLLALVVLILAGIGGWTLWSSAHSSTQASQTGALAEFRASGAAEAPPLAGAPTPGVYRYAVRGSESAGSGVVSAERPLPAEALYVITPIAGGYQESLRLSEEHVEEARFAVGPEAVTATWRRTMVTFLGIGEDDKDDVTPPSIDHPRTLAVGRTWGGSYVLGDLAVRYRGRVTGRSTVTIDGERIPVFTLRTDSTYTGSTPGTRTDVIRWSPAHELPVSWSITQDTGGAADFSMTAEMTLVSTTPER